MAAVTNNSNPTAVLLSGGGARGAYEARVIAGIVEILGDQRPEQAPFSIFTGTSVGAINAIWLAAHADRPDMNVGGLLERWRSLELREHVHISPMRFLWPSRGGERLRRTAAYPNPLFILGKVLSALLLDPINYDLGVMRCFNPVWGVLEEIIAFFKPSIRSS